MCITLPISLPIFLIICPLINQINLSERFRIWVSYGDTLAKWNQLSDVTESCILDEQERVTDVVVYRGSWYGYTVIKGLSFITTSKTCGLYGIQTDDSIHASGHQLLYISGRHGAIIDSITANFDYNCTTQ